MKGLLRTLMLLLGCFILCSFSINNHDAIVKLDLDDYICSEEQWVYLYGYKSWVSGNEVAIFDSAFIAKGQHSVNLRASLPNAECLYLIFSKNGPYKFKLVAEPNSIVLFNINEFDGDQSLFSKKAVYGELHNQMCSLTTERLAYKKSHNNVMPDIKKQMEQKWLCTLVEAIKRTPHSCIAYELGVYLRTDFPSLEKEIDSILISVAKRHPLDVSLKSLARIEVGDISQTPESHKASQKIQDLLIKRLQIPLLNTSINSPMNLSFRNSKNIICSTGDLYEKYILVDIWASWCKPCREEIPQLKQALKKYRKELAIYAVSLDVDHAAWQKAIQQDSTQMFYHTVGTYPNGQKTKLLKQLNVKVIPTNFLLDDKRHIIAKDLRGSALMQTLDSLMTQ